MNTNIILIVIYFLVSTLYVPLNRRRSRYYWESRHDSRIPLIPVFAVPYVALFPFVALTITLLWNSLYESSFLVALIVAKLSAVFFWYVFPNGVRRPKIQADTWAHKLLLTIYSHDHDTNAFPSSHVFISLICAYFLALGYPAYAGIIWLVGCTIAISTIFTKQHYVIDVYGGIIVFVLSSFITHFVGLPVFL